MTGTAWEANPTPTEETSSVLSLILGVLSVTLSGDFRKSAEDISALRGLTPLLRVFRGYPDEMLQQMMANILAGLVTLTATATSADDSALSSSAVELDAVLQDMQDQLVPVRAGALMRLARMAKSKIVQAKLHEIFAAVQPHLAAEESYHYLAAVQCVSALVSSNPSRVCTQHYRKPSQLIHCFSCSVPYPTSLRMMPSVSRSR